MTRILLVEDNEMNWDVLTTWLTRRGFDVTLATDGQQGIALAQRQRPDLILMDMSLPVIDGWEATRRLKQSPDTHTIPIIGLSAHAMGDDRDRALIAGCNDYDTKPVDFNRLLGKIQQQLSADVTPK
jgi:two-component system, cell cycle response regulator DivK